MTRSSSPAAPAHRHRRTVADEHDDERPRPARRQRCRMKHRHQDARAAAVRRLSRQDVVIRRCSLVTGFGFTFVVGGRSKSWVPARHVQVGRGLEAPPRPGARHVAVLSRHSLPDSSTTSSTMTSGSEAGAQTPGDIGGSQRTVFAQNTRVVNGTESSNGLFKRWSSEAARRIVAAAVRDEVCRLIHW